MPTLKLAWRSIWRNKRRTWITVSSIALGLFLAVLFVTIADGVYAKLIDDAVRIQGGHITLEHPDYRNAPSIDLLITQDVVLRSQLERLPQVARIKALLMGQGVAKSGSGGIGVAIMGVEPKIEKDTSPLARQITDGGYLEDPDAREAVIGVELAKQLKLAIGMKLVLASNDVHGNLVEELVRVKGIFQIGSEEIDGYLVQVPIGFARKLFGAGPDQMTQLGILLKNIEAQEETLFAVAGLIRGSSISAYNWEQILTEVASYIRMDGGSNLVFQGLLLALIMFTIFNTLLMSVLERQREFAVVLALGTSPGRLKRQILLESVCIGLLGCMIGLAVGSGSAFLLQEIGLDIRSFMREDMTISGFAVSPVIHAKLTFEVVAVLGVSVFGATLLLSLYPIRRAVRVTISDVLR